MSKKILVIDDDEGILEGFQAVLESEGYEVVLSLTAESIEKIIRNEKPDLILLDILLSGIDGRIVCKKLKAKKELKDIPIIMTSAKPRVEGSVKEVGADDYISKPFETEELLRKIEKYSKNV
jgi:DNA-binding response OmpR family regulator